MAQFFVTGIGTGVGKTFCTCAFLHQYPHYRAIKPVLSGFDENAGERSDAHELLTAMQGNGTLEQIAPWRFKAPLSPHLAAALEGKDISPDALLAFCKSQLHVQPNLLIEGVGGIMVPITPEWLVLDWMKALNLPVILVSSSYLGAINHTLLSIEALNTAALPLQAVMICQSEEALDVGMETLKKTIIPYLPEGLPVHCIPRVHAADSPWKNAPSLLF